MKEKEIKNKKSKKKLIIIFVIVFIIALITGFLLVKFLNKEDTKEATISEEIIDQITMDSDGDVNIIGYLTIPSLELDNAPIAEGTDDVTLNNYIGHFTDSSYLEGNVAVCAHNRGYDNNYFSNLKNIQVGDYIYYITKYEAKCYQVNEINTIKETDVQVIENTGDNRMTLITCVENQSTKRLCVVATEVASITYTEETKDNLYLFVYGEDYVSEEETEIEVPVTDVPEDEEVETENSTDEETVVE